MKSVLALSLLSVLPAAAAPPTGAYLAWLQAKFPADYGNPALEASVWGDHADPDGDGCGNMLEFMMAREPKVADAQLGPQSRIDGNDLVVAYRETTAADPGVTWMGEWAPSPAGWLPHGVRYQTLSTHAGYRMVEARVARNREERIFFHLQATR